MRRILIEAGLVATLALAAAPSGAADPFGGLSALGGGGAGLLGGGIAKSSIGNATGVLSYCIRNKFLGGGGAKSALNSLLGRRDVTTSRGFARGQSGEIVTGKGTALSLDDLKGKLKAKVCDMVLQHAQSFL